MRRQPAKTLGPGDVRRLLAHAQRLRYPDRARVMILLSYKAGLRACEIAGLTWPMVLASNGEISRQIAVTGAIAKYGRGRLLPMNEALHEALKRFHRRAGRPRDGPIIQSERGAAMTPGSVVNWFTGLYRALELQGCSSHSGRRTFITQAARLLAKTGGSLRDIQELAGHRAITTTERYIEGDRAAQRKLIDLI